MNQNMSGKVCACPHHKMMPLAMIVAGLAVVGYAVNILTSMAVFLVLGIVLVVKGFMKLNTHKCKCCDTPWR